MLVNNNASTFAAANNKYLHYCVDHVVRARRVTHVGLCHINIIFSALVINVIVAINFKQTVI